MLAHAASSSPGRASGPMMHGAMAIRPTPICRSCAAASPMLGLPFQRGGEHGQREPRRQQHGGRRGGRGGLGTADGSHDDAIG